MTKWCQGSKSQIKSTLSNIDTSDLSNLTEDKNAILLLHLSLSSSKEFSSISAFKRALRDNELTIQHQKTYQIPFGVELSKLGFISSL